MSAYQPIIADSAVVFPVYGFKSGAREDVAYFLDADAAIDYVLDNVKGEHWARVNTYVAPSKIVCRNAHMAAVQRDFNSQVIL